MLRDGCDLCYSGTAHYTSSSTPTSQTPGPVAPFTTAPACVQRLDKRLDLQRASASVCVFGVSVSTSRKINFNFEHMRS